MRKVRDYYFKKAKEEHYPARSVYKLMEIDSKYHIVKRNLSVLDIGCTPGSWSQYMLNKIGDGRIIGVDLSNRISVQDTRFTFIQADINDIEPDNLLHQFAPGFDLITSDAAPKTTGNKFVDAQNSLRIVERVFEIADLTLKPGGSAIVKVFQGEDTPSFIKGLEHSYTTVTRFKPKSSRKESRELFIIALKRRRRG